MAEIINLMCDQRREWMEAADLLCGDVSPKKIHVRFMKKCADKVLTTNITDEELGRLMRQDIMEKLTS